MSLRYKLIPAAALTALAALAIGRSVHRTEPPAPRHVVDSPAPRVVLTEAPAAVRDIVAELRRKWNRDTFIELLNSDPRTARLLAAELFSVDEEFLVDFVDDVPTLRRAKRRDLAVARLSAIVIDESADALYAFLIEGEKTAAAALRVHGNAYAAKRLLLAWDSLFKAKQPLDTYFILEALATMPDAKAVVREALLAAGDPSRKNMLLSIAPKIDKAWALELALDVLRTERMRQVRDQAVTMLGMIGTAESETKLLSLLDTDDFAEAANVLLGLDVLHVDLAALQAAYAKATTDLARAVLANLLARDPESAGAVAEFVRQNAASADPFVRFYALNAYAALAANDAAADAELLGIYAGLDREARALHPAVFEVVTKSNDPRAEALLLDTLVDEESPAAHRAIAATAMFQRGRVDPVVDALRATQQPDVTSYYAGVIAASPGGVEKLKTVSAEEKNPEKKSLIDRQVEIWSQASSN